jgi:hypothetical protein
MILECPFGGGSSFRLEIDFEAEKVTRTFIQPNGIASRVRVSAARITNQYVRWSESTGGEISIDFTFNRHSGIVVFGSESLGGFFGGHSERCEQAHATGERI